MLNFHRMQNFIFPRFLSTGGGVLTNKLKTDSDLVGFFMFIFSQ